MSLPKITIIIANYNYGEYLKDCVDSGLRQDYDGEITVCVVNDGSSDNSWEVLKEILDNSEGEITTSQNENMECRQTTFSKKRKLVCINQQNGGASKARNTGIDACWEDTDAFCILDADDEYYPSKVSILVSKWLEDTIRIGVVYADYHIINTSNGRIVNEFKEPYDRHLLLKKCIVHSGALISKDVFENVREESGEYYDSDLHGPASEGFIGSIEDYDLWIRVSEKFMICHIPKCLSLVKITGLNQSSNMSPEIFQKAWHIVQQKIKLRNAK